MGKGPGGKHDGMKVYSPDEAQLVMRLVSQYSPRWTHIAKLLSEATQTERTAASVRNYYKRFCASKAIADGQAEIRKLNRCQICGEIKRGHICKREYVTTTSPVALLGVAPLAESLLALSSNADESVLPLAPASLEVIVTPSPVETLSGGPFSALSNLSTVVPGGPLSATMSALGSPGVLGISPGALGLPPAVFARPPTAMRPADESEERYPEVQPVEDEDEDGDATDEAATSTVGEEMPAAPPADHDLAQALALAHSVVVG